MSSYIEIGDVAVAGVFAVYGVALSRRERCVRLRLRRLGVIASTRLAATLLSIALLFIEPISV
jgi:hypothetical protein